jgi:lipopolysaccharide export system permease protein
LLLLEPGENQSELKRIVFARQAVIGRGQLILKDGWERVFSAGLSRLSRFSQKPFEMKEAENYFLKEWKEPARMNLSELKRYSLDLEQSGMPATRFRLESEFRRAFSASILVFILMACAGAGFLGHKGFLWPLAASLITGFIYWQSLAVFRSLGLAGGLSPFLSAWSPQIIFLLLGIYFLLKGRT